VLVGGLVVILRAFFLVVEGVLRGGTLETPEKSSGHVSAGAPGGSEVFIPEGRLALFTSY
jgi:hypothetical protein